MCSPGVFISFKIPFGVALSGPPSEFTATVNFLCSSTVQRNRAGLLLLPDFVALDPASSCCASSTSSPTEPTEHGQRCRFWRASYLLLAATTWLHFATCSLYGFHRHAPQVRPVPAPRYELSPAGTVVKPPGCRSKTAHGCTQDFKQLIWGHQHCISSLATAMPSSWRVRHSNKGTHNVCIIIRSRRAFISRGAALSSLLGSLCLVGRAVQRHLGIGL